MATNKATRRITSIKVAFTRPLIPYNLRGLTASSTPEDYNRLLQNAAGLPDTVTKTPAPEPHKPQHPAEESAVYADQVQAPLAADNTLVQDGVATTAENAVKDWHGEACTAICDIVRDWFASTTRAHTYIRAPKLASGDYPFFGQTSGPLYSLRSGNQELEYLKKQLGALFPKQDASHVYTVEEAVDRIKTCRVAEAVISTYEHPIVLANTGYYITEASLGMLVNDTQWQHEVVVCHERQGCKALEGRKTVLLGDTNTKLKGKNLKNRLVRCGFCRTAAWFPLENTCHKALKEWFAIYERCQSQQTRVFLSRTAYKAHCALVNKNKRPKQPYVFHYSKNCFGISKAKRADIQELAKADMQARMLDRA